MAHRGVVLGLALAIVCGATPVAMADIPTTTYSADGGPPVPPPHKADAPRTDQRTEKRQQTPSLG